MRLLFTFLFASQLLSAQVWVQLPDFPGIKRDDGVAVVVNNKAYFGTGLIEWSQNIDFWALDLSSLSWTEVKALPNTKERQSACIFSGSNCFYVFGGNGLGMALKDLYRYDVASNSWSALASKPGNGLIGAACMNFGDKIIISGGKLQSGKTSAEVWEYTISTDSWQQKNDYPFPGRYRSSASVLNGAGYLIFGLDTAGAYRKEFYKYTPASDSWTIIMNFPMTNGRAYSSLNVVHNKLFLFGGNDTLDHYYKDIWYFNEPTTSWSQGPDIPSVGRQEGLHCTSSDHFYYSCGLGEGSMRLTETWMTDIPLGIKENYKAGMFSVYPNPTQDVLNYQITSAQVRDLSCRYYTALGAELGFLKNMPASGSIDFKLLEKGIYILKFYSDERLMEVKRIIKN